jgi:hypothetical protein
VIPHSAEFWDNAGRQKMRVVFDPAAAAVTGERMQAYEHQHGRTNL